MSLLESKYSKSLKTPLRYPGGKSRALKSLFNNFFPDLSSYKSFREPFLGGGSVSLHVTKLFPHIKIWVNDLYKPLFIFWTQLQENGIELSDHLTDLKNQYSKPKLARTLFEESKEFLSGEYGDNEQFEVATRFYVVNKCGFSGLGESSSFSQSASESNFSLLGISKLKDYQQIIKYWKITNLPYQRLLRDSASAFIYSDPPYEIKDNLYGRKGSMHKFFDHDQFAERCNKSKCHHLISYNNSNSIKQRFSKWNAAEFAHTYTMRSSGSYSADQSKRMELVLFNYKLIKNIQLFEDFS